MLAIQAQEKPQDSIPTIIMEALDEVVLTATRTERQLSSLPLPVQIIKNETIRSTNALRLSEVLNEQTGLITIPDFGGVEGIQMQGLDSQYTLILVNGVPLIGRSAGTLDLNRIALGNVKQIEIVKGASSSLYGSDALGGVINIITESPREGIQGSITHRSSTFDIHDTNFLIDYKKKRFGMSLFVDRYENGGYDLTGENGLNSLDPYSNVTINPTITYEFGENTKLNITGRIFSQKQDLSIFENQGEANITDWNSHLRLTQVLNSKWEGLLEGYISRYKADEFLETTNGDPVGASDFDQLLARPELRLIYKGVEKWTWINGIGMNHEKLERSDFSETPIFNSPYVYSQLDGYLGQKLNVIFGARFDAHNSYRSQFSPKLALRYDINQTYAIKGSVGYGFKAPDFRQLYFNFSNSSVGYTVLGFNAAADELEELSDQGQIANIVVQPDVFDDDLSPENSLGINLGMSFTPSREISAKLNLFHNTIEDLIDTRVIANKTNGQNVFSYFNVDEVITQGLEVESRWQVSESIQVSGGYQLLVAKDQQALDAFKKGEVFARETPTSSAFQLEEQDYFGLYNRSRHMANFKLFYKNTAWKANANIRGTFRSKFGLIDTNGNNYLDRFDTFIGGYSIWDIAINKSIAKNFEFGLGVDNLLDFTDPQNISAIPGRIIYGKINLKI
ncbi:MAG: TonB-dependent receptor [Flavobacteriaceae bacterium]|nr:TonB-dependent receptor [Flavobacteriaceae bacterium]